MPSITVKITSNDEDSADLLRDFVENLAEEFSDDSTYTGIPHWGISIVNEDGTEESILELEEVEEVEE